MPFPHEAILGSNFFSALVDAFLYHSWPSATRDREMHQLVLRKSQTLELPHVEKIQFLPHGMWEELGFSSLMVSYKAITNFFFPIGLLMAPLGNVSFLNESF